MSICDTLATRSLFAFWDIADIQWWLLAPEAIRAEKAKIEATYGSDAYAVAMETLNSGTMEGL